MNNLEFIKLCNDKRKANKFKWVMLSEVVNGKNIRIKFIDTWVQRLEYNGIYESNCMDQSVREFNAFLQYQLMIFIGKDKIT